MNESEASSLQAGRVELCYHNVYGAVCDDYWNDRAAAVVCRGKGVHECVDFSHRFENTV